MPYSKEDFASAAAARPASQAEDAPPSPLLAPTGSKPGSYDDALRNRGTHSKFADPCAIAREESMNCLNVNGYDKAKCIDFFQAYRDCKNTWLNQRREDRRAGKDVA
ncbi:hypothetical protein JCM11251_000272 [Rhodosporidiobolus azoricus]